MALFDVLLFFSIFSTIFFFAWFHWIYNYWNKNKVPYLKPSIPFGNAQNPLKTKNTIRTQDLVVKWYQHFKAAGHKYGGNLTQPQVI